MDLKDLLDQLNHSDECNYIEAKKGSAIDRSIMETVCAFSNEPGLEGGYILLGVEEETLRASGELRDLSKKELLIPKGKGRATYYVPGKNFSTPPQELNTPLQESSTPPSQDDSEPVHSEIKPVREDLVNQFPLEIKEKLTEFTARTSDKERLKEFICELCSIRDLSIRQLSILLKKQEKYLLHNFIKPMREEGKIEYTIPDMPNHPQQAYKTSKA